MNGLNKRLNNQGALQWDDFKSQIAALSECSKMEKIDKGYSNDDKYIIFNAEEKPQYILRIYPIEVSSNKRSDFEALKRMELQGINCSRPIEIGVLPELELGYMVVSFIDGHEAKDALPLISEQEQFDIGVQAGRELFKIHRIYAPDTIATWNERMTAKHQCYRLDYARCAATIKQEWQLLSFIDANLHLMHDRPNCFQHDDFHPANLIVNNGKLSGIIDFNRCDWGDPIHEFVKVGLFSSEVSVPFSVGQIQGYHHGEEPTEQFWQLYCLYLAMELISSVVWMLKVKPEELPDMMAKIDRVMEDHECFELIVPKWYSGFIKSRIK
ncbi:aminoglycoside phosphotransferase family protein [Paenibacillus pasadenensis]|uniref:aminoglycoside phosphotransferase family protein n=1 Tax=Paenibacillus pasadenensis TaxID=217090 RepID=UPI00203EA396|nr:aminoglycoside phosphotransferase family protein [Paenibacillus pasadenensis]MCM3746932.1 aminoglycoside phosphotransferase family protein [Paenibacillus pasadenensis]